MLEDFRSIINLFIYLFCLRNKFYLNAFNFITGQGLLHVRERVCVHVFNDCQFI